MYNEELTDRTIGAESIEWSLEPSPDATERGIREKSWLVDRLS